MRLYHTSNIEIPIPDLYHGRKNADFGQGFYLTPDLEFTYRWAGTDAMINEYKLDESGLMIHKFHRDEEWFSYIFQNRRLIDSLSADVIIGPIANDTIFDTLGIISSGYLNTGQVMKLLMIGPEYTQVVIKTEKAAKKLCWLRSQKIEKLDENIRKAEQEEYQAAFAEAMLHL